MKLGSFEDTHNIIQCPQCQTKFAVETTTLSGLEAPRFHCSRCDSIFALDAKVKLPKHSLSQEASGSSAPSRQPAIQIDRESEFGPETRTEVSTGKFRESDSAAKVPQGFSLREIQQESLTADAQDWTIPVPSKDSEIQISAAGSEATIARATTSSKSQTLPGQMHFDFSAGSLARKTEPQPTIKTDTNIRNQEISRTPLPSVPLSAETSRWTSFTMLAIPLVFFMSAVFGTSYYLRQNIDDAENLLFSMSSNMPQVAPAELLIDEAQFKRVNLDSGEIAYLVSGVLTNSSDESYKEILLEGLAFDAEGQLVARTKVDAGATLAKTRISSLSPTMIKELQSGKIRSRQELKPGQSQPFTFALLDGEPQKAQYFTARVYSIK